LPFQGAPLAEPNRLTIVDRASPGGPALASFAEAVRRGLLARPKTLPWQYFYDEVGSQLFDRICQQPEYYLTRTEDAILRDAADDMVADWPRAPALIELGSGTAAKTRSLIRAALKRYGSLHYVPIDVSPSFLEESARVLVHDFPALRVTGYVADYQSELARVAEQIPGPKLVIFLGSSLGNYETKDAVALLGQVARGMGSADRFLLGTDLAKSPAVLEAAYDDAQGVTAQFNRNLLTRINRELGADFVLDQFIHQARYRQDLGRVEMYLVSRSHQTVRIPGAELTVQFEAGESIHTENSHKYTRAGLSSLAAQSGFLEEAAWTDHRGLFRVQRWRLRSPSPSSIAPDTA
jgi:L-histidine Nalpha-methyltransferase